VMGVDTLSGQQVELSADLVVLGMAMLPGVGARDLAARLGIVTDEQGFFTENHIKIDPLESTRPGIYLAGTAQGPRDIPDSVAQGSGAASKVMGLLAQSEMTSGEMVVK
jgi:heterodisulfide reductase subunit A